MPEYIEKNSTQVFHIMQQYVDNVQHEIEYKFGRKLEKTKPGIRKWYPGEYQDIHADGETAGGWPGYNYIVDYGSIIYLNDDYEGGELFFPKYDIFIKPKPGTLIFFPSTNMYTHGVTEVKSGIRYTSPHFWTPTKHKILMEMAKMNEG
jgi:predicted 2-oxoglutarate/Fe(II)-dependent dioxygenase YbiX